MELEEIPKNITEAIEYFKASLCKEDLNFIKNESEDYVCVKLHHNFGRWIRNNFRLWEDAEEENSDIFLFFKNLGLWHADDMSDVLIRSLHRYIQNIDLDIKAQIDNHKEYWAKKDMEEALE